MSRIGDANATASTVQDQARRVLIVDDHPLIRDGLAACISRHEDLQVCGQAEDAESALRMIEQTSPDLVVLDLLLRDGPGFGLLKNLHSRTKAAILVVSVCDEALYAERAIKAGARGYIMKGESSERILDAMRQVLGGRRYLSPRMTDRILDRAANDGEGRARTDLESLTDRELEVFALIGRGQTNSRIADLLHLSVRTVETHRDNIKAKLGVQNSVQLVQRATLWAQSQTG